MNDRDFRRVASVAIICLTWVVIMALDSGVTADDSLPCCSCPPLSTFIGKVTDTQPQLQVVRDDGNGPPVSMFFTLRSDAQFPKNDLSSNPLKNVKAGDLIAVEYYTNTDVICLAPLSSYDQAPPDCQNLATTSCKRMKESTEALGLCNLCD